MNTEKPVIAVVDDEPSICKALERLLRSAGLSSKTFLRGEDFLCYLHSARPDCLVLDLHMPEMNGFMLMERLAQQGYRLPIIIITADDQEENREKASAAGISNYLRKPIDAQVLLNAIASVIDGHKQLQT